jgi:hypothetical protein
MEGSLQMIGLPLEGKHSIQRANQGRVSFGHDVRSRSASSSFVFARRAFSAPGRTFQSSISATVNPCCQAASGILVSPLTMLRTSAAFLGRPSPDVILVLLFHGSTHPRPPIILVLWVDLNIRGAVYCLAEVLYQEKFRVLGYQLRDSFSKDCPSRGPG